MDNIERMGHFTSSQIYKLVKSGRAKTAIFSAAGLTYIEDTAIERRMKRNLDLGAYSQPMAWGKFMEQVIFNHLGIAYQLSADESTEHYDPKYAPYWSGSKDLYQENVLVGEIKCYQPKEFARFTDALLTENIDIIRKERPKEYWQVVSNAIINKVPYAELISFMPYESEMKEIRDLAEATQDWQYRFIWEKENSELPCLPDNGYYKNINIFRFEVPLSDIKFLTERVDLAINELNKY